jgi:multidrug efflux pump subunit AcrA (membrane-fusion protein)
MSKGLKWFLIVLGILVVLLIVVNVVRGKDAEVVKVTAERVKRTTIVETVSASGKIYPELEVKVGTGITGEVIELNVEESDTVTKGQVVARIRTESNRGAAPRINPSDYSSLLQNLQASQPASGGTISIKAPISGTVSMLSVKKGERTGGLQSGEFMRIADMSSFEVRVDVNENDIIKVSTGDSADVEVDAYSRRRFKGVVTYIANSSQRRELQPFSADLTSYEVRIRLDSSTYADLMKGNGGKKLPFRPGMNARADIKTSKRENVLSVPIAAVASRVAGSDENVEIKKDDKKENTDQLDGNTNMDSDLQEVVFVIGEDGKVEKRIVHTGIQDINRFEILDGLKEGETVVGGPYNLVSNTLKGGQKVKVVSKEELFEK